MADLVMSLLAVLLIGFVFVSALGVLLWVLPIERLADWLDRNDRRITSGMVVLLALLASLIVAGSGAIRL